MGLAETDLGRIVALGDRHDAECTAVLLDLGLAGGVVAITVEVLVW